MLTKLVNQISDEMGLTTEQSERVVDLVLTEVKAKLPAGFQRNFVAVMNGEREFSIMDNFTPAILVESDDDEDEPSSNANWKKRINGRISALSKRETD